MREIGTSLQQFAEFLLKARLVRHYSLRTGTSYVDWVRRFVTYLAEHDGPRPTVTAAAVRDFHTPPFQPPRSSPMRSA
jgi:hypothetical protein